MNVTDSSDNTPLHLAVCDEDIAQLLVDHGADSSLQNQDGNTPLHLSSTRGIALTNIFMKNKDAMDMKNNADMTVLAIAVKMVNVPLVKSLLSAGANPNVVLSDDKTVRAS